MTTTTEQLAAALRAYLDELRDNGAASARPIREALARYDDERAQAGTGGERWTAEGWFLRIAGDTNVAAMTMGDTLTRNERARRIAACVNALAGVPTEALESLTQHQRRQDSLATVARVLGSLA